MLARTQEYFFSKGSTVCNDFISPPSIVGRGGEIVGAALATDGRAGI